MATREDWMRRLGPLYGGAVALVHSTPWRWPTEVSDETRSSGREWRGRDSLPDPGWIVALGIPIGVAAWAVAWTVARINITPPIAALLGLAVLTIASAALIERGVAERIDQLQGQARSPGVISLLVLVFATLVRAAAIVMLPAKRWLAVFVATAVVGRWAAVFLQGLGDPISEADGKRSFVASSTPAWLTAALSIAVAALTVFALGTRGIIALIATAAAALGLGLDAQRREGRLSAPVIAVAAAIGEIAVLIVATAS